MDSEPPKVGSAERPKNTDVLPPIQTGQGNLGGLTEIGVLHYLVEAKVGQMKAEMERDFAEQLGKIDALPTKWQLIAGGASAIIVTVGLLFAVLSYFGDRQDSAIDRSATLSGSLEEVKAEIQDMREDQNARQQSEPKVR